MFSARSSRRCGVWRACKGPKTLEIFTGQINANHNLPVYYIYSHGDIFFVFFRPRGRLVASIKNQNWHGEGYRILCLSVQGTKNFENFPF